MYTHKVEVTPIIISKHPNADQLEIGKIFSFTCCVPKGVYKTGDLVAYIQPDSIVDSTRPEFAFLQGDERIRVKKLRGVTSMGLVVAAPSGAKEGDDVAEFLGVSHYEPKEAVDNKDERSDSPQGIYAPRYTVESLYRFSHLFTEGEIITATEKIHGVNARFVYSSQDKAMFAGSKNEWRAYSESNLWWKALSKNPWVERFCLDNPNVTLYGEIFGNVQSLKYGAGKNDIFFKVFDCLENGVWWDQGKVLDYFLDDAVPLVYCGPFNLDFLKELAEGKSRVSSADHIQEGLVVRPINERTSPEIGRVVLKLVSNAYLASN